MTHRVRLFARARDLVGTDEVTVVLPETLFPRSPLATFVVPFVVQLPVSVRFPVLLFGLALAVEEAQ